jgi:glycosyltransferase involved in cell wall biosynthesis
VRILFAARRWWPDVRSGSEVVMHALHGAAVDAGADVRGVAGFVRDPAAVPPSWQAVDLRRASRLPGGAHLAMARAVAAAVGRERPDAVLANQLECVTSAAPTVWIVHDLNFGRLPGEGAGLERSARLALYRRAAAVSAGIVVPSEATRVRLEEAGIPASRVTVVPNGVVLPERAGPAADGGPHGVLVPGRILPGKGAHLALDAFARLPAAVRAGSELWIVGAATDRVFLDRLRVQAWGLPVRIVPDAPDMAVWLARARVVLLPTRMDEGFGLVALEAQAHGVPVVAFDQPALREATGGHARFVPSGDVPALRDALRALLVDAPARVALGEAGRAWARGRTWSEAWAGVAAVLRGVAASRS